MHIVHDYKHDPALRRQFCELARSVFSIDFEEWYAKGMWGPEYICYSLKNDSIISNVSVNRFRMEYLHRQLNALQISTVMTAPEYRQRGHAGRLMKHVIDKYRNDYDMIYLFTDDSNIHFYEQYGFKSFNHGHLICECTGERHSLRQLDMASSADMSIAADFFKHRKKYYSNLTIKGYDSVFFWHCLNTYRDCMYIDSEAGYIGIFNDTEEYTDIYDVLITGDISFDEAICRISGEKCARLYFDNKDSLLPCTYENAGDNDIMLILGGMGLIENLVHPLSAHA